VTPRTAVRAFLLAIAAGTTGVTHAQTVPVPGAPAGSPSLLERDAAAIDTLLRDGSDAALAQLIELFNFTRSPRAWTALLSLGPERVRRQLGSMLGAPDVAKRRAAGFAIGLLRYDWPQLHALLDPGLIEGLLQYLDDPDPEIRLATVESVAAIGFRTALPHVIDALRDPDVRVRLHAATRLRGEAGIRSLRSDSMLPLGADVDAATEALLAAAADADPDVRVRAALALAELGETRAVPLLLRDLQRLRSGGDDGDRERRLLDVSLVLQGLITQRDPIAFDALAEIVHGDDMLGGVSFAEVVAPVLPRLDPARANALGLTLMERPSWAAQRRAVRVFLSTRDPALADRILRHAWLLDEVLYRDLDRSGYRGRHDSSVLFTVFRSMSQSSAAIESGSVAVLARVLGRVADADTVGGILEMLMERAPGAREAVVVALGESGDGRAVEPLIERLQDASIPVRAAAARALGTLGNRRAITPLIALLESEDLRAVLAAARPDRSGSARQGHQLAPVAAMEWVSLARSLIEALVEIGDQRALSALVGHLDRAGPTRDDTIAALCRLGADSCTTLLIDELHRRDKFRSFEPVIVLLGRYGDERAGPVLVDLASNGEPRIRPYALRAMGERLGSTAADYLRGFLDARISDVREMAVARLARLRGGIDLRLLSRDFSDSAADLGGPGHARVWLVPGDVVTELRVRQAARRLGVPPEDVRVRYEVLAKEFRLVLAWQQ
jgi:HEAT repeat protein